MLLLIPKLIGGLLVLAAGAAIVGLLVLPARGDVTGAQLSHSLTRELVGGVDKAPPACRRRPGSTRFSCRVADNRSSERVTYDVRLASDRCWTARRARRGGSSTLPQRAKGCVKLRDQITIADRFL